MPLQFFCGKLNSLFIPGGRLIFNISQSRRSLRTILTSGATVVKVKSTSRDSAVSSPLNVLIKRQIQIKTSEAKTHKPSPVYPWDKVSPDYTLVYQFGYKNWIWTYYVLQPVFAVASCLFFGYAVFPNIELLSQGSLKFIIVGYGIMTAVILSGNIWFRNMFIRIYHSDQSGKFVGVRRTCFGRLKKLYYSPADVVLSGKDQQDIDVISIVKIRGRTSYLTSSFFTSPKFYNMHIEGQESAVALEQSYVRGPKF